MQFPQPLARCRYIRRWFLCRPLQRALRIAAHLARVASAMRRRASGLIVRFWGSAFFVVAAAFDRPLTVAHRRFWASAILRLTATLTLRFGTLLVGTVVKLAVAFDAVDRP